jgi:hypothetical protein
MRTRPAIRRYDAPWSNIRALARLLCVLWGTAVSSKSHLCERLRASLASPRDASQRWSDLPDTVQSEVMHYWPFYVTCVLACICKATRLVAEAFKKSAHFRASMQKALALTQPPFKMSKVDLFRSSIMYQGCLSGAYFNEEEWTWCVPLVDLRVMLTRLREALLVGALPNLTVFDFHESAFHTDCLALFTAVCHDGTLTHLKEIYLDWTSRREAGWWSETDYLSLSNVISNGVLPSLKTLALDVPIPKEPSKVLRSACKERGIEFVGNRYEKAHRRFNGKVGEHRKWVKEGRGCNAFTGLPFDYSLIDADVLGRLNEMSDDDLEALCTRYFGYKVVGSAGASPLGPASFSLGGDVNVSAPLITEKRRLATKLTIADLEAFSSSKRAAESKRNSELIAAGKRKASLRK